MAKTGKLPTHAKFFLTDPRSTGGPARPRPVDIHGLKGTKTH
jgi:hypothetical protein